MSQIQYLTERAQCPLAKECAQLEQKVLESSMACDCLICRAARGEFDSSSQQRVGRPLRETVKRMDCPTTMREHCWSIERNGMIECLWCFERRRSEDRERPTA